MTQYEIEPNFEEMDLNHYTPNTNLSTSEEAHLLHEIVEFDDLEIIQYSS